MSNKWNGPGVVTGQDGKAAFVRYGSVYVRVSLNRLTKMGEEFRNTEFTNVEHHKPCNDSEKGNVIQHKEDDDAETKSTANANVVTNDTHYDNPDTVQNKDDVSRSAQNGIESVESSLPGEEMNKLSKAKIRSNTDFKVILNGRRLRSWEELTSPLANINPSIILRILVMMEPVVLIWIK